MPLADQRYLLHFACVCPTQGPTNIFALGDAQNSPHRGLRLFHLTLGIDYSRWKTLLCTTVPWLSIPWLQHCYPCSVTPALQCSAALAVRHQQCPRVPAAVPGTGTVTVSRGKGKIPHQPSQAMYFHCLLISYWHSSC